MVSSNTIVTILALIIGFALTHNPILAIVFAYAASKGEQSFHKESPEETKEQ